MASPTEERTPLLSIISNHSLIDELNSSNDIIPLRSRTPTLHCHVAENPFNYSARNRLVLVLILCIIFIIIEIVGGILSNSTAVITDAVHMLIDAGSFLISLVALYLSRKRPTKKFSYGYIRAEVLGALVSVLTIWLATGILVYAAILRFLDQTFTVHPTQMLVVAVCGVVFNIVMFALLHVDLCGGFISHHGHSHGHKHNEPHETELSVNNNLINLDNERNFQPTKPKENINIRAAIIHTIGDFIQSIGVLIAAILIKVKPEYKLADPICTLIFAVLVLITTLTIIYDIVLIFMEAVPSDINYRNIIDDLYQISGVRNVHNLHVWLLSMEKTALSVHIAINNDCDYWQVLNEAQQMLRCKYSIVHSTIQIESYDEVMRSCENCRQPIDC